MDEADIYYVDTRNADHRHPNNRPGFMGPFGTRPVYHPPTNRGPVPYSQAPVIYAAPPQSAVATLFGKMTTGQVIEMVGQLFAALQPLPAAPIATKDTPTDLSNLILFQNALAQHAKRDEQVRTLGGLVARLVG
ncbi:MAG: hypothetical protein NT062_10790 [Proteobacteria bacterium]|nr:hypothetical protein [Pseudomonadota bacterium]